MKLDERKVARLEHFLDQVAHDTYPETPSQLHDQITEQMVSRVWAACTIPPGAKVLDVGCGQGVALKHFAARGCEATGITINNTDLQACRCKGFSVAEMDQSFLEFPDGVFDLVWCRHCLEHSVFPFFTLNEFQRVLRRGGWLYIEVPAPDTSCQHQKNRNHYSVLGKSMLMDLMARAGFEVVDAAEINFTVAMGPDVYWSFILRKT